MNVRLVADQVIVTITCHDPYAAGVMFDDIGDRLQQDGVASIQLVAGDRSKVTRTVGG